MRSFTEICWLKILRLLPKRVIRFLTIMSVWTYLTKLTNDININPLVMTRMNRALNLANKEDALMVGVYSYKFQVGSSLKTLIVYSKEHECLGSVDELIHKKNLSTSEFDGLVLSVLEHTVKRSDNKYTDDRDMLLSDISNTLTVGGVVSIT